MDSMTKRLKVQAPIPFEAGRKAGIMEVVEWIRRTRIEGYDQYDNENPIYLLHIEVCQWQAKLKDWGIEKK